MLASTTYYYNAYGLRIQSVIALPELVAIAPPDLPPDVVIDLKPLPASPLVGNPALHSFLFTPTGLYLYWRTVGTFLVVDTHTIFVDPDPQVDEACLRLFILGAALGAILHQRGYLVLHACAAVIDGKAVVAMGNKGWGKSTLVATLAHRGHGILSDDVVAIDLKDPSQPMVLPAFAQVKLWADAVAVVCDRSDSVFPITPSSQKKQILLRDRFQNQAVPLGQLLVLGLGNAIDLSPLSTQDTIQTLLIHTYVTRFRDELMRGDLAARHLDQLTRLINWNPIYRLSRPCDLSQLGAVADALEAHVREQLG